MKYIKEPVNALTHLIAAIVAIPAILYLLIKAQSPLARVAFLIYGLSMIALYLASGFYHMLRVPAKTEEKLRKLDHSMIFILIAGTYTPICLMPMKGPWGYAMLIAVWILAAAGVTMKMFWMKAPRWLSTALYLIMGWICLFALVPLIRALSTAAFLWLLSGGILYSIGAVIYGRKKCLFSWRLGFHEVFHIFIILGTVCQYITMLLIL